MGKEATFWKYLQKIMKPFWEVQRIESGGTGLGIPDVTYTIDNHGFIELKAVIKWPIRETTPVKVNLTPLQKLWLWKHGRRAGLCFVFVKIVGTKEYFLFDHSTAQDLNDLTKQEFFEKSIKYWRNKIDSEELTEILNARRCMEN